MATLLVGVGTASDSFGRLRALWGAKLCSRKLGLAVSTGAALMPFEDDVEGAGRSVGRFRVGTLKVVIGWPPSVNTIKSDAIRSTNSRFAQL